MVFGCWMSADSFETLPDVARRRARRSGLWSIPERLGAMNIRTIVLVMLGLVLVSAIVLSTTALASVLILGDFHWKRVAVAAGFSCRLQIQHFTGRNALHPAALLGGLLEEA